MSQFFVSEGLFFVKGVTNADIPIFLTVHLRCRESCECFSYFVTIHGHQCCVAVLRKTYLIEDVTILCIYLKEFFLCEKARVDLYLFMIY